MLVYSEKCCIFASEFNFYDHARDKTEQDSPAAAEGAERYFSGTDEGYARCDGIGNAHQGVAGLEHLHRLSEHLPLGAGRGADEEHFENQAQIRYALGQRVRYQLRIVPELRFFIDDSLDYIDRIDELLKK